MLQASYVCPETNTYFAMKHFIEDLMQWYRHACRRVAIHPLALPGVGLVGVIMMIAVPAPCMEQGQKAQLQQMKAAERKARIRQLYSYHESRDPCDVQERILLERIDAAQTPLP